MVKTEDRQPSPLQNHVVSGRGVGTLVIIAMLSLVPYSLFVLVPYFVNGLHQLPLAEVAGGRYDPKDLWPHGWVNGWAHLFGVLSVAFTPMLLVFSALAGIAGTWWCLQRPTARGVAMGYLVATALCVFAVDWFLTSDTARYLAAWQAD